VSFEVDGKQYIAVQSGWGVDPAKMQARMKSDLPRQISGRAPGRHDLGLRREVKAWLKIDRGSGASSSGPRTLFPVFAKHPVDLRNGQRCARRPRVGLNL